jgi:hypothetical protein
VSISVMTQALTKSLHSTQRKSLTIKNPLLDKGLKRFSLV